MWITGHPWIIRRHDRGKGKGERNAYLKFTCDFVQVKRLRHLNRSLLC